MTLSSTELSSSSLKMATDESSRDEELDWSAYLVETQSEAAPACNFKQALIPPVNDFSINEKLETIDPRNQDSWCIGTVVEKDGPRLRIRLDGTDDRNDFWRLVDAADIRSYKTTEKQGGQIVPPLGFQQNSTRWAKYFEKNVKNGPFAAEFSFKPQPTKPEKNLFKKGQKLEAVDPRHPQVICPATVHQVTSGDHRIMLSLDGWSSSNNFKVDYASRDIFPVGWCQLAGIRIAKVGGNPPARTSTKTSATTPNKSNGHARQQPPKSKKLPTSPVSNDSSYSPTTMDEKNNNLTTPQKMNKGSMHKKSRRGSLDLEDMDNSMKKEESASDEFFSVTVYLNYTGDNGGITLNPQKFRLFMPSMFGPAECSLVLTSIFDSCIKCTFQPTPFINRILELFSTPDHDNDSSHTKIQLENGTTIYIPHFGTQEDFWDVIRKFQNAILAGNDLFIASPPLPSNPSNGSSSSFLDSSLSPDKKDTSPLRRSPLNNKAKRQSTELLSTSENQMFLTNGKVSRSDSHERSVYDTKPTWISHPTPTVSSHSNAIKDSKVINPIPNGGSRRPERFTPSDVAAFVRGIDPSFDNLASRFLQEEIDGKALLLLTTDTLMRHMGLKLGPSLKIVHHIEQLKKS